MDTLLLLFLLSLLGFALERPREPRSLKADPKKVRDSIKEVKDLFK